MIGAQSAKAYIEARLRQGIVKDDIARQAHMSPAYLRELFARENGMPLGKYITRRKISNAAFDILYTDRSLTDIALDYGYDAYDTFTRAFKRVTGCKPIEFRRARPMMQRRSLGGGIFGVELISEKEISMDKHIESNEHSVILYDVPRVSFGSFGGCTPYPISLKACANYMGEDIDYADAITGCGAAFRMTWNTSFWDGGNMDVCHTYQESDPLKVYMQGVTALGRSYRAHIRAEEKTDEEKEKVKAFIVECLRAGVPVIAMGMVGPPEAGLVTGFKDDGNTMLGWSVFQEWMRDGLTFDPCGYYITDKWWENGVDVLVAMGDTVCEKIGAISVAKRAAEVMKPRTDGIYRKGVAAYDAWAKDMDNDECFPDPDSKERFSTPEGEMGAMDVLKWRLMCQNDAADCIADGRYNAAKYFRRHKDEHPSFSKIADAFDEASSSAQEMYKVIGGFERGDAEACVLGKRETRDNILALIKKAKEADTRAYELLARV